MGSIGLAVEQQGSVRTSLRNRHFVDSGFGSRACVRALRSTKHAEGHCTGMELCLTKLPHAGQGRLSLCIPATEALPHSLLGNSNSVRDWTLP